MLETLGPQVAGGNSEVFWSSALVLEFLLDSEGLVHSGWLQRLGEGVQLNVHLLNILASLFLSLVSKLSLPKIVLYLLFLKNLNLGVWLWLLLFLVSFRAILEVSGRIKTSFKRLTPDIITSALVLQNSGLGGACQQCEDCQRNVLHFIF